MSSQAKNLEALDIAIKQHKENCEYPLIEILMNPFEVERLGWDDYRGIPIVPDEQMGTGRFRLVCSKGKEIDEEVEDVAVESELTNV